MIKTKQLASILLTTLLLTGCGNIKTIKSFSTSFAESTSGQQARIRIISDKGMVRGVPNSECIDYALPGSGVMTAYYNGFADLNWKELDLPDGKFPDKQFPAGAVWTELAIDGDKPIALHYILNEHLQSCSVMANFTPESGQDYEAYFKTGSVECSVNITNISENKTSTHSDKLALNQAELCNWQDMF
ncbi:hypothetical protein [Endozoicomonas acroporae]|uniref:hypothetical protein n=1 Tax=Endozoicomonas acroporae TaxID=1701104 RepID=UPI003D7A0A27